MIVAVEKLERYSTLPILVLETAYAHLYDARCVYNAKGDLGRIESHSSQRLNSLR